VPAFEVLRLMQAGSVFVTRPTLVHYLRDRAELLERAEEVLGWVANGTIDVQVTGRYGLDEAGRAHEDLEARRTTGKLLIIP
jgi:NADPH:quinone reductase